jgi:hypothetical protein
MEKLKAYLDQLIDQLEDSARIREELGDLVSVFPFNEYEYMISTLLGRGKLTLDSYYVLRDDYIERNLYLHLFEISSPTGFGLKWAQGHLKALVPELEKPTRKKDPSYSGQYDFWLDKEIRIEVKASRAVDFEQDAPLYVKALATDSSRPFDMNFQQLKPACCDVFVWIGAWRNTIRYWVLASKEVESSPAYSSSQHRGNLGEGQLHLRHDNIDDFAQYEVLGRDLLDALRKAHRRQRGQEPQ